MHIDIYTGSYQKTLRPVVNLLNKEINHYNNQITTDYIRVKIRKHLSWITTRDEQNSPWISQRMTSFPSNSTTLNLLRTHLEKLILCLDSTEFRNQHRCILLLKFYIKRIIRIIESKSLIFCFHMFWVPNALPGYNMF